MERSLVAHTTLALVGMLGNNSLRIPGLMGWAAQVERGAQNQRPFGHLADIEAIPGQLRAAVGD